MCEGLVLKLQVIPIRIVPTKKIRKKEGERRRKEAFLPAAEVVAAVEVHRTVAHVPPADHHLHLHQPHRPALPPLHLRLDLPLLHLLGILALELRRKGRGVSGSRSRSHSAEGRKVSASGNTAASAPSTGAASARVKEERVEEKRKRASEKTSKPQKQRSSRSASPRSGRRGNQSERPRGNQREHRRTERSPTPRPCKIHVGRLTRNVTREHVIEIFSAYGQVRNVEFPQDRLHQHIGRGFAYVEFSNPDEAEEAMRHMDGG
ncbi:hypothetical protein J437_LFUL014935 [Ladona fulva]|uniref:RRM domain-containing protein n=1 Tax=Ladona fulva TaxID=123851 RepID=A0A8K0P6V8_LADFU|nr:hypothetical protein J437_LFUL014935 [Ladona fulva]